MAAWDLFCRVIDNFGDIGVCWRLAAELAARGRQVRLWVDDARALDWMAPEGAPGVDVIAWTNPAPALEPGDVVIEAFGCDPPDAFVQRMARRDPPPLWINLEYLSAQAYVERSHGLASPQPSGLVKRFWYPGFTARTGGLIREQGLLDRQHRFDAPAWLATWGIERRDGERIVSLFCYEQPALPELLDLLAERPTLLLATAGHATRQVQALLGPDLSRGGLRVVVMPALPQRDYDHLLWSADLNFVRGEDSLVRALWAAKPFVWQIYPQHDGAHAAKLHAFIDRFLEGSDDDTAASVRAFWTRWNGLSPAPLAWPDDGAWRARCIAWRDGLLALPELTSGLIELECKALRAPLDLDSSRSTPG